MKNLIITILGWITVVAAIGVIVVAALLARAGKIPGYDFVIACFLAIMLLSLLRLLPKNKRPWAKRRK